MNRDRLFVISPAGGDDVLFSGYVGRRLVTRSTVPASQARETLDLVNSARMASIDQNREARSVVTTRLQHEQRILRSHHAKEAFFEGLTAYPELARLYEAWRLADRDVLESSRSLREEEAFDDDPC